MNQKNLLFFKLSDSSFILNDEKFLQQHFQVHSICQNGTKGFKQILFHIRQLFFLITHIKKAKYIFIWFADYHAFLPILFSKVFNKKSYLVLGGYDAIYMPELEYGVFSNPLRTFIAKRVIENADFLLPVDLSLLQSVKKYVHKINGKIEELPTGYDPNKWFCDDQKENLVITVAGFNTSRRIKIKGLDFFVKVAKQLPEYQFQIIGAGEDGKRLLGKIPNNLQLIKPLAQNDIRKYLSKAKVYAQFSLTEGLPNAVCEAMLCGCIPIGTNVGGMKKLVDGVGYLLETQDMVKAKEFITKAIKQEEDRVMLREKITKGFSSHNRQDKLLELMDYSPIHC